MEQFCNYVYSRKDITTFDELWIQCILEETILKAKDDTEPNEKSQAFTAGSKKKKGRRCPSNSRGLVPTTNDSYIRMKRDKESLHIQFFNCHKWGHYAQDCLEKNDAPRSYNNNHGFDNRFKDRRRRDAPATS